MTVTYEKRLMFYPDEGRKRWQIMEIREVAVSDDVFDADKIVSGLSRARSKRGSFGSYGPKTAVVAPGIADIEVIGEQIFVVLDDGRHLGPFPIQPSEKKTAT